MASQTDWERIEAEYRAGQFSIREIARQHGISEGFIRKKAKEKSWERDLTQQVRDAVRAKAVRNAVRTDAEDSALTDKEIIDFASDRGAQVLVKHQTLLSEGQELCARLLKRVKVAVDEIEGAEAPKTQAARMQVLAVTGRAADLLHGLMQTASKVIPLERQAFSLDAAADESEANAITQAQKITDALREIKNTTGLK